MTNDDGRKPEGGSAEAGAGARSGVDGNGPTAFFCSAQDGDCRATVARRAAGTGGAGDECLDRQADRSGASVRLQARLQP